MIIRRDIQQGTDEWLDARKGIPTASEFDKIITATGRLSSQADKFVGTLIAERLGMTEDEDSYVNRTMQRGTDCEPEARAWYSFHTGYDVEQVGFITNDAGTIGCSPDGIMPGMNRGLELKCPLPKTHFYYRCMYRRTGLMPDKYLCQVHGSMVVTGWDEWDFASYCPGTIPLLITVKRNDFTERVAEALAGFVEMLRADREQEESGLKRDGLHPEQQEQEVVADDVPIF